MSGMALEYVMQRMTGSPKARLLSLCLAHHVNNFTGKAFPGQKTLSQVCGFSERTVRDAIREIEAGGLIKRRERRNSQGERTSDEYELLGYVEWREQCLAAAQKPDPKKWKSRENDNRQILPLDENTTGRFRRDNRQILPGNKVIEQGSYEGADKPPSISAMVWSEGKALLSCLSKPNHSIIGKWLKRTPSDESKEVLLRIIRSAADAGTADPVSYVSKALAEAFPPPPDPKTFTPNDWQRNCRAAIKMGQWSANWGPAPGKPGCLVPVDLVTSRLVKAVQGGRTSA